MWLAKLWAISYKHHRYSGTVIAYALWRKRKRVLGTQFLVTVILKLVQSKNQQGYGRVL